MEIHVYTHAHPSLHIQSVHRYIIYGHIYADTYDMFTQYIHDLCGETYLSHSTPPSPNTQCALCLSQCTVTKHRLSMSKYTAHSTSLIPRLSVGSPAHQEPGLYLCMCTYIASYPGSWWAGMPWVRGYICTYTQIHMYMDVYACVYTVCIWLEWWNISVSFYCSSKLWWTKALEGNTFLLFIHLWSTGNLHQWALGDCVWWWLDYSKHCCRLSSAWVCWLQQYTLENKYLCRVRLYVLVLLLVTGK